MITNLLFSFFLIALAMAGLAIGVLLGGASLRGSCGGIACVKEAKCAGCPHAKGDK